MTSPVSMPAGHLITAADMDAYENLTAVWTSYTPTWTATTTNPTIGNGTIAAAYKQVGKTVWYRGLIVFGSTTTAGTGTYELSWPVTPTSLASTHGGFIGSAYITDFGVNGYTGVIVSNSVTALRIQATSAGQISNTVPFAFGSSDRFSWIIAYEAA